MDSNIINADVFFEYVTAFGSDLPKLIGVDYKTLAFFELEDLINFISENNEFVDEGGNAYKTY